MNEEQQKVLDNIAKEISFLEARQIAATKAINSGFVVTAHNNNPNNPAADNPDEQYMYSVAMDSRGNAKVAVSSRARYYRFTYRTDAERIAKGFNASNGYGKIEWFVISELDYVNTALIARREDLQRMTEFFNK